MNSYQTAYIGLGSNLDNPLEQITSALKDLKSIPQCRNVHCSDWYGSKAIGPGDQPDYVNAAISLETQLAPFELLYALQTIENAHGRQRSIRWGARTLDLDILLYENHCLDTDELRLPHPEIFNRNFVLYPLYDLNPELIFPDGQALADITRELPMTGLYRIDNADD